MTKLSQISQIAYTGLNKKLVIIVSGVIFLIILTCVAYTLWSNNITNSPDATPNNIIKQPSNINVIVNNVLNTIQSETPNTIKSIQIKSTESALNIQSTKDTAILIPLDQPNTQSKTINTGVSLEPKKPTMFTDDEQLSTDNNQTNAITKTDTSVGVGVIDSKLKSQHSPYTIFAGSYIPAQMINSINSDLNGMVIAQVRHDVYDTTKGKYLLIPQGSKIIGTYNHDIAYGQNRLIVGWNRIIYPNGTSFNLHGQPGTDLEGFSGFSDDVDNHYLKIFGSAFIMGAIFGGTSIAVGNQNSNPYQLSAGATIANQVGAQMAQAGIQVIQRGLNIQPTIIIHAGYQFDVALTADLILKPYIYRNGSLN